MQYDPFAIIHKPQLLMPVCWVYDVNVLNYFASSVIAAGR